MNRQIYKMTLSDASDSITFYLLEVPIADDDITGTARNTTIDGNVYEDYLWLKKQWSQKWSIMCKDEYDKLRGIWKRQYTDSEVVSVKYFYGDNIYTDGEVEGNTMQINNDSEVYEGEIRGFELLGNTTQTTLSGKNLMPILNIERTINNVKFTPQADGSVLVNGTNNTANYAVYVLTFNTAENNVYRTVPAVAGTYYISNEGTIPSGVYVQCFTQITGQSVSQKNADGAFTVAENFNFGCAIRVDAGTTVNNLIIKPMVEKTTTKTSWEPYVGSTSSAITPSPNPDYPQEVKTVTGLQTVKIEGKNLAWTGWAEDFVTRANTANAKIEEFDGKNCLYWTGSVGYGDYEHKYIFKTRWQEGAQYTVSFDIYPSAQFSDICFEYTDGTYDGFRTNMTANQWQHLTMTSTLGKTIKYIKANYNGGNVRADLSTFQIEKSNNVFDKNVLPSSWANTTSVYETLHLLPNTTYTFASDMPRANGNALLFFLESGQTVGTNTNGVWDGQTRTLTTDSTGNNLQIAYRSYQGETRTRDDYVYTLSHPTAYEPYQGQSYELNLGKNLFDKDNANVLNAYINASSVVTSSVLDRSIWLKVEKNTNYTVSMTQKALSTATAVDDFQVGLFSSQPDIGTTGTRLVSQVRAEKTVDQYFTHSFNTGNNEYIVVKLCNTTKSDYNATLATLQIEAGTQATSYSAYKTPLELCKIGTYQDYIWNDNGTWKKHEAIHKVVLNGTETVSNVDTTQATTTRVGFWGVISSAPSVGATLAHNISNYFVWNAGIWASDNVGLYTGGNDLVFRGAQSTIGTTEAQIKTWLSTHNTIVYYPLATPTDTEITDSDLVGQLEALLAGSLYKGLNNVFLIPSAGADGTMTLDYRIDYEKETVVQDTTPVLLDLTDDGIINACQCRQNVKITMRETVQ